MADTTAQVPRVTATPPPELRVQTNESDARKVKQTYSRLQENGLVESPAEASTPARISSSLLAPSPPSGTPRDESPDRLSPLASGSRIHSALKTPSRSRLGAHSPLSPLADDVIAEEGPNGTAASPAGRKEVQFSQHNDESDAAEGGQETPTTATADRGEKTQSLYSRLRALATAQGLVHTRSASNVSARSGDGKELDGHLSAASSRQGTGLFATLEEGDSDADAEESGAEASTERKVRPLRRHKKPQPRRVDEIDTAPPSPHSPMRFPMASAPPASDADQFQPRQLTRAATDSEATRDRIGVSEDEGRKRNLGSAWKPRHPLRGLSYGGQRKTSDAGPEPRREGRQGLAGLRMLTTLPSAREQDPPRDGETVDTPKTSRRKLLTERGTTLSAQKWRQLRQKIQQLGQTKKKERTQDHQKSAELLAELQAGGPAALMLASMFQRDENGARRVPVLLEQLKVRVVDSEIDRSRDPDRDPDDPTTSDRHIVFRIELEYGSGINRMKWVIHRSLRDFANLHARYKIHFSSERFKGRGDGGKTMPKFPKKAFPYLKDFNWGMEDFSDDSELEAQQGRSGGDEPGPETDNERPRPANRPSFALLRRKSSIDAARSDPILTEQQRHKARKRLELYLQRMINFMLFRADSNRLCKFLEVSALGMRLAAEGSYHGKEGFLMIQSAKGIDFRNAMTPEALKTLTRRYSPKWFLVRHSYVVCVDSPEEMHIYDVFLFDVDFRIQSYKKRIKEGSKAHEIAEAARETAKHPQHHRLKLHNSERRLKLLARTERQLHQFEESIQSIVDTSPWCQKTRFESFAPVRDKCFAQWLVDGRDYMWVVSRAINQAKDVIYIHDWWLSPELYMRRPPAISQKWRLDRLLKRKAEEGVKVFVIVYRNVESAIPIDSQYTKFSLLDLHPNVFVQRSPNQIRQNTFFWAHHEKICIVDHTVAFVGGIDLCFGRWDTPQHTLIDDKPTGFEPTDEPKDADHCQLWPGKDYSNPREQDFYALNKPYEEMYDRQKTARMPWHDISMQVVGQPARDLTRHFVQRWNYILRQRKPTRPTPFLLPPPDFNAADLEALGLDGTCEVQILRSAGPWSMGTPNRTEHSIMNAYVKMIEDSDHFVYMENQFFISSCETERVTVHNKIGDALVERIARAHKKEEAWRAVIVIPLIPGFQNTVEQEGGTSVRLIMQYQYRSICRGESSIFGRLRALGIDPEEYIQFYSLRQWGRIGPRKALVTEQLYIHAKCMVVDDRVAIIGSANINERSMLGNRDSECAAIVRDTDMIWSRMNGQPYQVGRFPHTLRMRLMREHLGLDVDKIMEDAQAMEQEHNKTEGNYDAASRTQSPIHGSTTAASRSVNTETAGPVGKDHGKTRAALDAAFGGPTRHLRTSELKEELLQRQEELKSFNHDIDWEQENNPNLKANRKLTEDHRVTNNEAHRQDVEGHGFDHMTEIAESKAEYAIGRDSATAKANKEVLVTNLDTEGHTTLNAPRKHGDTARLPSYVVRMETPNPPMPPRPSAARMNTAQLGLPMLSQLPALPISDDTDIGGPPLERETSRGSNSEPAFPRHPLLNEIRQPLLDRDCMLDPIHDAFVDDTWHAIAENNTKIYRSVFRCMPDNLVRDWHEYHQYVAYESRFNHLQGNDTSEESKTPHASGTRTGPPGAGTAATIAAANLGNLKKVPTDMSQSVKDMKKRLSTSQGHHVEELAKREKDDLRAWAREANQKQAERQGKNLQRNASGNNTEPFPAIDEEYDEKTGELLPIPEADGSRLHTPSDSGKTNSTEVNGMTPSSGAPTATADATVAGMDFAPRPSANAAGRGDGVAFANDLHSPRTNGSNVSSGGGSATADNINPAAANLTYSDTLNHNAGQAAHQAQAHHGSVSGGATNNRRRRRATTRSSRREFSANDDILSVEEAEELLGMVRGVLVLWPYDWLEKVEAGSNWLFSFDQISPIEIYV